MASAQLYVRKTGSANNGGSSTGASPDRTGTDGVTAGTTTFVAASGAFTSGDVDKLINIVGKGRYRITGFTNSTTVTLSGSPTAGTLLTWNLGGACLNVGDLLQAAVGTIVNGDSIWIGAGVYREVITCTNTNTAEVTVNGDVDGAKTGDVGMVQITGFTTDDKTAGTGPVLSLSGKSFLTFKKLFFMGGGNPTVATVVSASTPTSQSIEFYDCAFICGSGAQKGQIGVTSGFNTALNWIVDRCLFIASTNTNQQIQVTCTTGVGADYDVNFIIRNSVFIGNATDGIFVTNSGTAANKGNGVKIRNCFFFCRAIITTATHVSTSIPSTINNCFIWSGNSVALNAGTSGQITENYNLIKAVSARTNVSAGANSQTTHAPLFSFGQEFIWGGFLRPFGEPLKDSPLLDFGNDGNQTSYDLRNNPRPAGGGDLPGVGALERSNTWAKETTTVRTGSNALSCVGPGYQDFLVPVDAVSTTIAVYMRYDSTYAGTKPRIQVLNGTECGVADATSSAVTTVDTWEQLSLTFTPTSKGIVTIRLWSADTNGAGKAFADDFSVT